MHARAGELYIIFFSQWKSFHLSQRKEKAVARQPGLSLIKGSQLKGTNALATLLICTSLSLKHAQMYGAHTKRRSKREAKSHRDKTHERVRARAHEKNTHTDINKFKPAAAPWQYSQQQKNPPCARRGP